MGRKEDLIPPLPLTNSETAEQRLEELVNNKSVNIYKLLHNQTWTEMYIKGGECRVFPDGFEGIISPKEGALHIERRGAFVYYNLEKEHEKQKEVKNG